MSYFAQDETTVYLEPIETVSSQIWQPQEQQVFHQPVQRESQAILKKRESNRLAAKRHRDRRANELQRLVDEVSTLQTSIKTIKAENEQLDTDLQILKMKFTHMYGYPPESYGEQTITMNQPITTNDWLTQL